MNFMEGFLFGKKDIFISHDPLIWCAKTILEKRIIKKMSSTNWKQLSLFMKLTDSALSRTLIGTGATYSKPYLFA